MAKFSRQLKDIANALIDVAIEAKKVADVVHDIQLVGHAFATDRLLATELMEPSISLEKRQAALKKALHAEVDPIVLNTLLVLQEEDLLGQLAEFVHAVITSAKERANHHHAAVTTTIKLNASERDGLIKKLSTKFGGTVELEEHLDHTILGGMIVDVDGWRYDASVVGACQRLKETLYTP